MLIFLHLLSGCSFNFELTSQKTALENQIMGSYKELDDEVLLMASVRGVNKDGTKSATRIQSEGAKVALEAKQNQSFNRDDIDELRVKQIIGEAKDGSTILLPKGLSTASAPNDEDLRLAQILIAQENQDRDTIGRRIVATNQNLTEKDLSEARKVYRKTVIDECPIGTWIEDDAGSWKQKLEQKPGVSKPATVSL